GPGIRTGGTGNADDGSWRSPAGCCAGAYSRLAWPLRRGPAAAWRSSEPERKRNAPLDVGRPPSVSTFALHGKSSWGVPTWGTWCVRPAWCIGIGQGFVRRELLAGARHTLRCGDVLPAGHPRRAKLLTEPKH